MKSLFKVCTIFLFIFCSAFIITRLFGFLTLNDIKSFLQLTYEIHPLYQALLVIVLLAIDILVTIPTLVVTSLSGHYLGFLLGSLASITGLILSGLSGFYCARKFGEQFLRFLGVKVNEIDEVKSIIDRYGLRVICISRAIPMLPELLVCLCGINNIPLKKFLLYWIIGSLPYALVLNYFGSISSYENPWPAIIAAILVSGSLGYIAFRFKKLQPQDS